MDQPPPQEDSVAREDRTLDVHLPYGKLHRGKEFFLLLFTIAIGLLIALGLEGWVEYGHHQHLAREAEAGLRAEIAHNANPHDIGQPRQQIKDGQKQLEDDLKVLEEMRAHPCKNGKMSIRGTVEGFDDLSWKTAQNTDALALMPYNDAQAFSDIYQLPDECLRVSRLHIEKTVNMGFLSSTHTDHWVPSSAQIDLETDHIGRAQMRLIWLSSMIDQLDKA
jgi:hypothetical protein